jgi:hypothetical protein
MSLLFNPLVIVLLVAGAVIYMQRARPGGTAGQRFLRGLWLTLLVLCTAGFGLCGGFGIVAGLFSLGEGAEGRAYGAMFAIVGGVGVVIALLTGWLLRRTLRDDPSAASAAGDEAEDLSPFSPPPAAPGEAPQDDNR